MICNASFPRDRKILKTYVHHFFELKEKLEKDPLPGTLLEYFVHTYATESQNGLLPQHMLEASLGHINQEASPLSEIQNEAWIIEQRKLNIGCVHPIATDQPIKKQVNNTDELKAERLKLSLLICTKSIMEQQMDMLNKHVDLLQKIDSPDVEIDFYLEAFRKELPKQTEHVQLKDKQIAKRKALLREWEEAEKSLKESSHLANPCLSLFRSILRMELTEVPAQVETLIQLVGEESFERDLILFLRRWNENRNKYDNFFTNEMTYKLHLIDLLYELLLLLEQCPSSAFAKPSSDSGNPQSGSSGLWGQFRDWLNL